MFIKFNTHKLIIQNILFINTHAFVVYLLLSTYFYLFISSNKILK